MIRLSKGIRAVRTQFLGPHRKASNTERISRGTHLPWIAGNYAVLGSWVVRGEPVCLDNNGDATPENALSAAHQRSIKSC